MPASQTKVSAGAGFESRTAQEVIDMFEALGLPVCDDAAAIAHKAREQEPAILRKLNSPTATERLKAQEWSRNKEALLNRRSNLLDIVANHFQTLADTVIATALGSGTATLTQHMEEQLRTLAINSCRLDPSLARRFVQDYKQARGLKSGGDLVRYGLVENLVARGGLGRISLQWTLPAADFQELQIVRETDPAGADPLPVFQGREVSFVDSSVKPGVAYRYTAYTWNHGKRSPAGHAVRAVCLGEVRSARAVFAEGRIKLSWELPCPGVSVLLFRRQGAPPGVQHGAAGPAPRDATTRITFRGGGTTCDDTEVSEGETYHYRVVCDFGDGLFTDGTDVQASVPRTPPAPSSLTALYRNVNGSDEVLLDWTQVRFGSPVEYIVVRRDGKEDKSFPPTRQTAWRDKWVVAGRRYQYSVFSRAGDRDSRSAAIAQVDIVADVQNLRAHPGDRTVELSWLEPPNVSRVIIRRSLQPPSGPMDGAEVRPTGLGRAKDEGLHNSRPYHYLVFCAYRPDGRTEVFSRGVPVTGLPDQLPLPVENFSVSPHGQEILCQWKPSAFGQVIVMRSAEPPGLIPGTRFEARELDRFVERLVANADGTAVDPRPDIRKPHYSIFTVAGPHAIVGGSAPCVVCPDVTALRLSAVRDGVVMRWTWPADCQSVIVARRADAPPEGHADSLAVIARVTRAEYKAAGNKFVQPIHSGRGRLHFAVFAEASGPTGLFYSRGASEACRGVLQWEPWLTLRYQLEPARGLRKGKALRLRWSITDPFPDFAGFKIVANQSEVPDSIGDGIELFRCPAADGPVPLTGEALLPLAPVSERNWIQFFCKLHALDPAQRHTMLVVHPSISTPFTDHGDWDLGQTNSARRVYRRGLPKEVVCPHCFEAFPVGELLYSAFGSVEEPVRVAASWWRRISGRPPPPPVNAQGHRLTRKICPRCRGDLPFTAGAQESLVIGLIGAKYSGKSTYVASLIHRLETQVGSDFHAALISVADWTPQRYKDDFHDPLFRHGIRVPATAGVPKPLIYDFTLSGRLWNQKQNRSVTLAFYDTAGEYFDHPDQIAHMVAYLRRASGILFLIDPLQAPSVHGALQETLRSPLVTTEPFEMTEPSVIISRVLRELENGKVLDSNAPLSVPVAVALTKCDVLRDAGFIEPNRLWSTEQRHIGYFDRQAHEDMAGMMGEYAQRWIPSAYNILRQRFLRHSFFGVSATGCAPDATTQRYKFVAPWRVEDPLLWLLAELGVVPVRNPNQV